MIVFLGKEIVVYIHSVQTKPINNSEVRSLVYWQYTKLFYCCNYQD